jgi:hypothetical protein
MKDVLTARLALRRKDQEGAKLLARELESAGFVCHQIGAFGIGFEGPALQFSQFFRSPVELSESPHFTSQPELPQSWRNKVESVYFPKRPTYFQERP